MSVLTPLLTQGVNTMNEIVITICLDPNDQSWGYYTIGSAPGFSVQGAGGIAHEVGGVWTTVSGPGSAYIGCDTPTEVPAEVKVAFGITCPATSPTTTTPSQPTTTISVPLPTTTTEPPTTTTTESRVVRDETGVYYLTAEDDENLAGLVPQVVLRIALRRTTCNLRLLPGGPSFHPTPPFIFTSVSPRDRRISLQRSKHHGPDAIDPCACP